MLTAAPADPPPSDPERRIDEAVRFLTGRDVPTSREALAVAILTGQEHSPTWEEFESRPLRYMSAEWYVMPDGDPAKERARDAWHAACWRNLTKSPHVSALVEEWVEWNERAKLRDASHGVCEVFVYRSQWATYKEIEQRRSHYEHPPLTPEEIRSRTAESWAELNPPEGAAR